MRKSLKPCPLKREAKLTGVCAHGRHDGWIHGLDQSGIGEGPPVPASMSKADLCNKWLLCLVVGAPNLFLCFDFVLYCLLAFCVCVHVLVYGWRLSGVLDHEDKIFVYCRIRDIWVIAN